MSDDPRGEQCSNALRSASRRPSAERKCICLFLFPAVETAGYYHSSGHAGLKHRSINLLVFSLKVSQCADKWTDQFFLEPAGNPLILCDSVQGDRASKAPIFLLTLRPAFAYISYCISYILTGERLRGIQPVEPRQWA